MRIIPYNWKRFIAICAHLLYWVAFLSFPILFVNSGTEEIGTLLNQQGFWIFAICFIGIFYLNAYVGVPYVIKNKAYLLYTLYILLLGSALAFYIKPFERFTRFDRKENPYDTNGEPPPPQHMEPPPPHSTFSMVRIDVASLYIFFLVISSGALLRIVQYWTAAQERARQIENKRIHAELFLLKAKVHPHFLFNTLNSIYALALTNDASVAESIYRLSQLMRYYMDEKNNHQISVQTEIQAIKDFINLQRLRTGSNCVIEENYLGLENQSKKIQPFILLTFVENAFKYGLSSIEDCHFYFSIHLNENGCDLWVQNSIPENSLMEHGSGTGLKTTRQLLEYFYPNRHNLSIEQQENIFSVKLSLIL